MTDRVRHRHGMWDLVLPGSAGFCWVRSA